MLMLIILNILWAICFIGACSTCIYNLVNDKNNEKENK